MKYNYKYARLDGDTLVYAPNKLIIGTEQVFNASEEIYRENGYMPITKTEVPLSLEMYSNYESYYEIENNSIVQKWREIVIPEEVIE